MSLEEFQEKKKQQRTKKKKIPQKITNTSAKRVNQNNGIQSTSENKIKLINTTVDSIDEAEKIIPVGSQKRKARKQSITRNTNAEATSSTQNQDKINQRKH